MSKTLVREMLVGRVDFGEPAQARSASYSADDAMARSIVRLRAEVAMLREQARILVAERDEAREALREIYDLVERSAAWDAPNNVSGSLVAIEDICEEAAK